MILMAVPINTSVGRYDEAWFRGRHQFICGLGYYPEDGTGLAQRDVGLRVV